MDGLADWRIMAFMPGLLSTALIDEESAWSISSESELTGGFCIVKVATWVDSSISIWTNSSLAKDENPLRQKDAPIIRWVRDVDEVRIMAGSYQSCYKWESLCCFAL